MNIVLVTPLYPPDIAPPALYVKELARRTKGTHHVSIVAYAHIPEDVSGVTIFPISKRLPVFERVVRFFFTLYRATTSVDHVYAVNGPSVELPLLLLSFVRKTPITLCVADSPAYERTMKHYLTCFVHRMLRGRVASVVNALPDPKPEILPFSSEPTEQLHAYEASWKSHLQYLSL